LTLRVIFSILDEDILTRHPYHGRDIDSSRSKRFNGEFISFRQGVSGQSTTHATNALRLRAHTNGSAVYAGFVLS